MIDRRVALLDRDAVGLSILCFVQVTLTHHRRGATREFTNRILELPEVLEFHSLTGEHDYLLKVVATDNQHLERILAEELGAIPGVDRLRTSIVLNEVKRTTTLPLPTQTDHDHNGAPLFLAANRYWLDRAAENAPEVRFLATREQTAG